MRRVSGTVGGAVLLILVLSCAQQTQQVRADYAAGLKAIDEYTLVGDKNFVNGYQPVNADETVNVVVEIPTGSVAKWEVEKSDGSLRWEFKEGKPRVVRYLGYPGNYGMIPRTLLPKEEGGDGDPLDVIVLGPAMPRGSVVAAKLIGVLKLLDGGEQDDKLIAVMADTPLFEVDTIEELDREYPGISTIIQAWFHNYKGPGELEARGFGDVGEARAVLETAIKAFK